MAPAIAYREERRRRGPVKDLIVEATFDYDIAPQGVYWMADRSEILVNVGIGMQLHKGVPNPRRVIRERVIPIYPGLEETQVIRSGGGIIPNRRPIDCFVAPGMVAVGDAACQVQPMSGSGIGASMYASRLAAETIAVALESTPRPTTEDLFTYPVAYQRSRTSLQAMTNAQMNRLMASNVVSEEDLVTAVRTGRLTLSYGAKLKAAAKLIGEPRLIRALARMQLRMEAARDLYTMYPSHLEGLADWRREVSNLFTEV
jgi:flavin-dependent dehydrogenase